MFDSKSSLNGGEMVLRQRKWNSLVLLLVMTFLLTLGAPRAAYAQQGSGNFTINSVNLTNPQIVDGVLHAGGTVTGTLAGLPFTTQITNFALQVVPDDPATQQVECSVLHLELAPIHLALLGLHVDTSPICLDITAIEGGGLLGDLLCGLAGGTILPTPGNLGGLGTLLTDLLNRVFGSNNPHPGNGGGDSVCTGECEILELVLGPLDLTLLGLNVHLDDCDDGPVQICVSASRGEGLLGDLLCGLTGAQILNLSLADIAQLATRTLQLLADGSLSGRDIGVLSALLRQLIRR